jgi:sporulation protein YlmC with PRC-barrel domain
MLCKASSLYGFAIGASDGRIGSVTDVLFDDATWKVRYLMVDTGGWLNGRTVLLSPTSIKAVRSADKILDAQLTRAQVEDSPPVDQHQPVSRRYETHLHDYYGWPYYWTVAPGLGVMAPMPVGAAAPISGPDRPSSEVRAAADAAAESDPHLRSLKDTSGRPLEANDGDVGHLEDLIIDCRNWGIEHAVVKTGSWLSGKRVVLDRRRIVGIEGVEGHVRVDLSRWMIEDAPAFDERMLHDESYDTAVHAYFEALLERTQRGMEERRAGMMPKVPRGNVDSGEPFRP